MFSCAANLGNWRAGGPMNMAPLRFVFTRIRVAQVPEHFSTALYLRQPSQVKGVLPCLAVPMAPAAAAASSSHGAISTQKVGYRLLLTIIRSIAIHPLFPPKILAEAMGSIKQWWKNRKTENQNRDRGAVASSPPLATPSTGTLHVGRRCCSLPKL